MGRFILVCLLLLCIPVLSGSGLADVYNKPSIYEITSRLEDVKRYDDLLKVLQNNLEKAIDKIDYEGILYILDDMVEIYTNRMVDFEKALETNEKALKIYNKIMETGIKNIHVSDYFNKRRSLYNYFYYNLNPAAFVDPDKKMLIQKDWMVEAKENLFSISHEEADQPITIKSYTPFPPAFLDFVREQDILEVKKRIDKRFIFLNEKLSIVSLSGNSENDFKINKKAATDSNGIDKMKEFLEYAGLYNQYYLNFYITSKAWQVFVTDKNSEILHKIILHGKKALDNEKDYRLKDDYVTLAYLQYWTGITSIKLRMFQQGIELLGGFIQTIEKYEEFLSQKQKLQISEIQNLKMRRESQMSSTTAALTMLSIAFLAYPKDNKRRSIFEEENDRRLVEALVQAPTELSIEIERLEKSSEILKELSKYQSPYAMKLNLFLTRHEQLEYFIEMGKAYKEIGELEKSIEHFKEAINIIENQRATILTEKQRIGFLKDREEAYLFIVPLLVGTGRIKEAFEYTERAKSRGFVDLMGSKKVVLKTDDETKAYYDILKQKSEIDLMLEQRNVSLDQYKNIILKNQIGRVINVKEKKPNVEFLSFANVETLTFEDVSELIDKDTAIVEYFITNNEIVIFVIEKNKINAISQKIDKSDLFEYLKSFRDVIVSGEITGELEYVKALSLRLYELLFKPISYIVSKKDIYIVPHGPLHYIPFQALYDGKEYLIKKYSISYLPSSTVLKFVMDKIKERDQESNVLIFANPDLGDARYDLSFAEEEASSIRWNFPNSQIFIRKEATETRAKEMGIKYNILHFASHGEFDVDDPFEASLYLVEDNKNDGKLTLGEVFSMNLKANLVVLSACQTGLSKISYGDELIGFARAFMYAGAPTITATLWRVDDKSTSNLMRKFYTNLKTMPNSEALQKAQIETMKEYPNPYHWAPFMLIGYYR